MESSPVLTKAPTSPRGFTLLEMIVVVAIILIITSITVVGQSTFNKSLLLTNTAYQVALSARQAQSFGLSSRKFGLYNNAGYGIHFSSATPSSYTFFADTSNTLTYACPWSAGTPGKPDYKIGNCRFDQSGTADGVVSTFSLSRGFTISRFCGKVAGATTCSDGIPQLTSLDIVFTRPNTSSAIVGLVAGTAVQSFSCAEITLTDANAEATKMIRISRLGEISIDQHCP